MKSYSGELSLEEFRSDIQELGKEIVLEGPDGQLVRYTGDVRGIKSRPNGTRTVDLHLFRIGSGPSDPGRDLRDVEITHAEGKARFPLAGRPGCWEYIPIVGAGLEAPKAESHSLNGGREKLPEFSGLED